MTYCGETLDSQNYISEFSNISLANASKEPLYVLFVVFFRSLGLSYGSYHAISSAIVVFIIGFATFKLATNYNLALSLFLIYPFALYVVQIRNCFAFSLCMIAFVFLNNTTDYLNKNWVKRNKNEALYALCIICASLIHSAYIVFLLFILAEKFDLQKVVLITAIAAACESIILNKTVLLNIAQIFNVRARLEYELFFQSLNGQSDIALRIAITFIMYLYSLGYLLNETKGKNDTHQYNQNLLVLKINIICLVILPVVSLVREIFRIQESLMLLNYIVITNNLDKQSSWRKDTIRNCLIIFALLIFIFVDDFLYILRFEGMRRFVLYAVFG